MESYKDKRSLNAIAYFIAGRLGRADDTILLEELKYSIMYWRAELLRRDIERNSMNSMYLQPLYVEFITVDEADNLVVSTEYPILRTKNPIPEPIRYKETTPFYMVGDVARKKAWTYVAPGGLLKIATARFVNKSIWYSYFENHIYVHCNKVIKYGVVVNPFVNPMAVLAHNQKECEDYDADAIFPVPMDMIETIINGILSKEFNLQKIGETVINK